MMRRAFSFVWVWGLVSLLPLCAQDSFQPLDSTFLAQVDSAMQAYDAAKKIQLVEQVVAQHEEAQLKREMSFGLDGAFPLVRGLVLSWTDHGFVKQPALFEPKDDRYKWTDYGVAGLPLATAWVLKAAGVKSRSKLERMLTANVMAFGLSTGVSQLLKHTVTETRPDQTDNHSFPSGHATVAFVSASIMSREYGYLSPWVTVGSYTTATATQLLRIRHNRHWMNDLYMGAGIGMVSTNLAYFLTDKIFGADAIRKPEVRRKDVLRLMRFNAQPSGLAFVSGTEIGNRKVDFGDACVKSGAAIAVGADLTWFTSPYFAVEAMARIVDAQMKVYGGPSYAGASGEGGLSDRGGSAVPHTFSGDQLDIYHFDLAAKLSTPIDLGKRLSSRVFAGTRILSGASFTDGLTTYTIPKETKFELGCGINFYCLDTDNYAWGFTADYFHTFSHYLPNRYSLSSVWKIVF